MPAAASEGAALARPATVPRLRIHIRGRANDWLAGWLRAFPPRSRFPREGERQWEREKEQGCPRVCVDLYTHTRCVITRVYTQLSVFPQRIEAIRSQMYRGRGFPAAIFPRRKKEYRLDKHDRETASWRERRGGRARETERERERRARPIAVSRGSVVDETVDARCNLSRLRGNTPARRRE